MGTLRHQTLNIIEGNKILHCFRFSTKLKYLYITYLISKSGLENSRGAGVPETQLCNCKRRQGRFDSHSRK